MIRRTRYAWSVIAPRLSGTTKKSDGSYLARRFSGVFVLPLRVRCVAAALFVLAMRARCVAAVLFVLAMRAHCVAAMTLPPFAWGSGSGVRGMVPGFRRFRPIWMLSLIHI